jgi:hypothetical protein
MPVKYIEVKPVSDLFVAATRAFGNIAIIGKGGAGTAASAPQEFTDPSAAAASYPYTPVTYGTLSAAVAQGTTVNSLATNALAAAVPGSAKILVNGQMFTATAAGAAIGAAAIPVLPQAVTVVGGLLNAANVTAAPVVTPLANSIATAFRQSPGPTVVYGVQVPDTAVAADYTAALTLVEGLDVQIVVLGDLPLNAGNVAIITLLANHVLTVSTTGGDGKERIGVAMLDPNDSITTQAGMNTGGVKNERMVFIAHKSTDDAAAALAGVIGGLEPQVSILLKSIKVNMTDTFADADIDKFDVASINWITSPVLIPGHALFMGEGYTADPSQNKKYIDIVRVIDDVNFRIKATLIQAIGNFRVSRSGLRAIVTLVQSILSPLQTQAVIEGYQIYIPLLVLLDKDPNTLTAAEAQQIQQHQADRSVDMVVTVEYAGAIHRLHISLVFK